FLLVIRRTPCSTLFPYTTLFRSAENLERIVAAARWWRRRRGRLRRRLGQGFVESALDAHQIRADADFGADIEGRFDVGRQLATRSEEHTSELQSLTNLVCRLLLE